ncbi:hypothetical protein HY492_01665 [Candidatus Woesearchaeota archaeon]|nr:hypothetical protein [Candidatus Woesearchaeota archaeon]
MRLLPLFRALMIGSIALIPVILFFALWRGVSVTDVYKLESVHMVVILSACVVSVLLGIAARTAYISSHNSFFRWLSWGYVSFGVIYAFHGLFTMSPNLGLFLIYGPVSRLVFAWCVSIALLANPFAVERKMGLWLVVGLSLLLSVVTFVIATSLTLTISEVKFFELLSLLTLVIMLPLLHAWSNHKNMMGSLTLLVAAFLASSSLLFLLGKPWNVLWWLAHLVLAAGFFTLMYAAFAKSEEHDFHVD